MSRKARKTPIETGTLESYDPQTGEGRIVTPRGERIRCYFEDQRQVMHNGGNYSLSLTPAITVPKEGAQIKFMRSFKKRDMAWKWGPDLTVRVKAPAEAK